MSILMKLHLDYTTTVDCFFNILLVSLSRDLDAQHSLASLGLSLDPDLECNGPGADEARNAGVNGSRTKHLTGIIG